MGAQELGGMFNVQGVHQRPAVSSGLQCWWKQSSKFSLATAPTWPLHGGPGTKRISPNLAKPLEILTMDFMCGSREDWWVLAGMGWRKTSVWCVNRHYQGIWGSFWDPTLNPDSEEGWTTGGAGNHTHLYLMCCTWRLEYVFFSGICLFSRIFLFNPGTQWNFPPWCPHCQLQN